MWRKQSDVKPSSSPTPGTPGLVQSPQYSPSGGKPAAASPSPGGPVAPSSAAYSAASSDAAVLTHGIRIKGELTGKADLFIDGEVEGSIRLGDSRLTIGPNGRVKANIEAREIAVQGSVEGNLRGRERILLGSSSRTKGDLEAPRVAIEEGAHFKGRVEMGPAADARERQNAKRVVPVAASPAVASSAALAPASVPAASSEPIEAHTKP